MSRAAMQQALEALEGLADYRYTDRVKNTMASLRQALAEPEQEPVALPCCGYANASAVKWNPHNQVVQCHNCGQVYTAPTPRKPLTDDEIALIVGECAASAHQHDDFSFARAIERAHDIGEQQ